MKTMYINNGINMTVDTETNEISSVPSAREAIQRIYVAPEPMHVIYKSGKRKEEADVDKNDVIVTFYTDEFEKQMIVVKSEEWTKNITAYEKRQQEAKEKWADEHAEKCEACENCESCVQNPA